MLVIIIIHSFKSINLGIHIFIVPTPSKQYPTFNAVTRIKRNNSFDLILHASPEIHGKHQYIYP